MAHHSHRSPALLAGLALALPLAGCGPDRGSQGMQVDVANTVNYGSFGTTAEIDCGQGKALNVGGSNNTLTITGTCTSISVGGADNTITIERVDGELSVVGFNNTVKYNAGEPTVNDHGSANRISRG